MAAVPLLAHVHRLVAHWRFRVMLGATIWYSLLLHVVQSAHVGFWCETLSKNFPVAQAVQDASAVLVARTKNWP